MKTIYILPLVLAPVFLNPKIASAGEIYHRESSQQQRIFDGVREGQITPYQFHHLENREAAVNARRIHDLRRNGGFLTSQEQRHLNHDLNKISHEIHRSRENGRIY
ncbi:MULTISPECIES: hypothetical protein [Nostocales]|uniref:Uncharacterized protein n=3 Tax=Nostocales TaxID=1161 RepID=A0A8S9TAP6_9CYAN|nr:hypothetical protein [Tolypothrix bouteillei]KAF3889236.1 hypothetical protein DA73_0400029960 [Tolypothrix bouteillei VB521301]